MATTTNAFAVTALPTTGTQYRTNSGATGTAQATAYSQAMRALAAWAKPTGNGPQVHALVHLGWCSGTGARATVRAASSSAYKAGAPHLVVGTPAAPQVCATLAALAKAGAPAVILATVWATYTGSAA
ncbi:MAG: hypothetical protein M3Q75_02140 [Gemmatimonadota bacterium]|nr:hypothetical protein [Gemmatimonadota bacterium]